jgi:hypothetical protein
MMKIRRTFSHDEVDCEPPLIGRLVYEKAVVLLLCDDYAWSFLFYLSGISSNVVPLAVQRFGTLIGRALP